MSQRVPCAFELARPAQLGELRLVDGRSEAALQLLERMFLADPDAEQPPHLGILLDLVDPTRAAPSLLVRPIRADVAEKIVSVNRLDDGLRIVAQVVDERLVRISEFGLVAQPFEPQQTQVVMPHQAHLMSEIDRLLVKVLYHCTRSPLSDVQPCDICMFPAQYYRSLIPVSTVGPAFVALPGAMIRGLRLIHPRDVKYTCVQESLRQEFGSARAQITVWE